MANHPSPPAGRQPERETVDVDQSPISEGAGTVIGQYKLLEQIGEGGFGLVFMAEQKQPLRRKVAIKVLKPGLDTRQIVARFEAERQALALMDHPNIAGVYDGGETAAGRPYFVMELVKGLPITKHCDEYQLTPRERLQLFIHVCNAVQHAHQKGIIHRDLKPSNLMVMHHDGTPVVKVIDFGIAKATGQQLTEKTLFTNFAQLIGTPEYMSPEQAGQSGLDVDTRGDIYSLGVILYELLTGRTPLGRKRFKEAGYDEMRRMIREEEPPKPSARVSTLADEAAGEVASLRKSDPKQLSKLFKGELDWIVMKALEKDRTRRYDTAHALAADVQRYLNDEAVHACPPSAWYTVRKIARRNKGKLAIAASLALVFLVFAGGAGWMLQERAGRAAKTASQVDLILNEATYLQKDKKWNEALAAVNRAEGLYAGGQVSADLSERLRQARATVEQRLGEVRADQQMTPDLVEIRLRQAEVIVDQADKWRADDDYVDAFLAYGIEVDKLAVPDAAARIREREIAADLVAALDHWAMVRKMRKPKEAGWNHLLAVAKAADPDSLRNQVRAALESGNRVALEQLATGGAVASLPASTLALLGDALKRSGADKEALVLLQRAQLEHPGDFWINHELAYALSHMTSPQHEKAISYYRVALGIRKSPGVYFNLAHSLQATGALEEGIAALRQVIRLKPDYAEGHDNLQQALIENGLVDEAIAGFMEAIRLKPDNAHAHGRLGNAYRIKGQLDEALAALKEAIRLKPDYGWFHYNLGQALRDKEQQDDAFTAFRSGFAAFREAVRLNPNVPTNHNALAWTVGNCPDLRLRDPKEALLAAKKAVELDPNHLDYWNTLGNAYYRDGQWGAALEALNRAVVLRQELAWHHDEYFWLAMVHWQLGNKEQARTWYDKGVKYVQQYRPRDAGFERFRAEAAELLEIAAPKK